MGRQACFIRLHGLKKNTKYEKLSRFYQRIKKNSFNEASRSTTFDCNGVEMKIPAKPAKEVGRAGCVYSKKNKTAYLFWIDKDGFLVVRDCRTNKDEIIGYVYMNDGTIETFDDRVNAIGIYDILDTAFRQGAVLQDEDNPTGWPCPCYWNDKEYDRN